MRLVNSLYPAIISSSFSTQATANPFHLLDSIRHQPRANIQNTTTNASLATIVADDSFNFNVLAVLSGAPYEGADIGEVLVAANNIKPGDFESFHDAFNDLADRVHDQAIAVDAQKHPLSARSLYFRSSAYYRAADAYLHGNWTDPRISELWKKQAADYNKAIALLPQPGQRIEIRADNFTIPAIYFRTTEPGKRPTVIMGQGFDGAMEDLYHVMGKAAVERGMNVIVYEGPGQPTVRRYQDLGFIPEWERVVTPIVSYLLTREDVDESKIALMGYSFGGFLAPRAAAFEHRLAAVIAIDGLYDFGESILSQFGEGPAELIRAGKKEAVDQLGEQIRANADAPTTIRWGLNQGEWTFKTHSAYDYAIMTQRYTLKGLVEKIKAPVFVGEAESDMFFDAQATKLAQELGELGTYHLFTNILGAGEHCQIGASTTMNQVSLDWLEDIFSTC